MKFLAPFVLLASTALAASIPPMHPPSPLAQARKTGRSKVAALQSRACNIPDYNPGSIDVNIPDFDADKAEVYRYRQQQAVNLGSVFVHESWMVPSIYTCAANNKISEIDIASGWDGVDNAKKVLEKHWDTFITEKDVSYLASIGINTVRLPIGYWSLGPDFTNGSIYEKVGSVYENSWPRVMRTVEWAGKYGIGVLVDLHGAYGSQNGQDHSGVSDGKTNLFTNKNDQDLTIKALVYMTKQLVNVTNCVGIQILNEPKNVDQLVPFYNSAIDAMRAVPGADKFPLYVHDGFDLNKFAKYVGDRDDFVVVDHHSYFVFTSDDKSKPVTALTSMIKSSVADNISSNTLTARGNLVTDEWGCALADGSTHVSNLDTATAAYCQGQEEVYRTSGAGYAFWSYMMDDCESGDKNGWCFKGSVGNNLPAKFFSYSSQTSPADGIATSGSSSASSSSSSSTSQGATSTRSAASSSSSSRSASTSAASAAADSASSASASPAAVTTSPGASCKITSQNNKNKKRSVKRSRRKSHKRSLQDPIRGHSKRAASNDQSEGYNAGYNAAKKFASMGASKIGFKLQYIKDTAGDKATESYINDYYQGIKDAESDVDATFKRRK